jgi:hypothetical protein
MLRKGWYPCIRSMYIIEALFDDKECFSYKKFAGVVAEMRRLKMISSLQAWRRERKRTRWDFFAS